MFFGIRLKSVIISMSVNDYEVSYQFRLPFWQSFTKSNWIEMYSSSGPFYIWILKSIGIKTQLVFISRTNLIKIILISRNLTNHMVHFWLELRIKCDWNVFESDCICICFVMTIITCHIIFAGFNVCRWTELNKWWNQRHESECQLRMMVIKKGKKNCQNKSDFHNKKRF